MDRVHGRARCDLCHLTPSMGWLYVCRQDLVYPRIPRDLSDVGKCPRTTTLTLPPHEDVNEDEDISPTADDSVAARMMEISLNAIQSSPLRAELEDVGLSESIIK